MTAEVWAGVCEQTRHRWDKQSTGRSQFSKNETFLQRKVLMFRTRELHHRKLLPVLVMQVPAQPGWPVKENRRILHRNSEMIWFYWMSVSSYLCVWGLSCCQRDTFKWWIMSGQCSPFASSDSGMFSYFLSSTRRVWGVWEPVPLPLSQAALQSQRGVDEGLTASSSPPHWELCADITSPPHESMCTPLISHFHHSVKRKRFTRRGSCTSILIPHFCPSE